jgi:D-glycero-D-manno-heptose 1,7-bisphosphate phosphatase
MQSLSRLHERLYLGVATSQSGVARGFFNEAELESIHAEVAARLRSVSVGLETFYYCPHLATAAARFYGTRCSCRKPAPDGHSHSSARTLEKAAQRILEKRWDA